jgi:hypothetical protein
VTPACPPGYTRCDAASLICYPDTTPTIPPVGGRQFFSNPGADSLDGAMVTGVCVESVYYSACRPFSMQGYVAGGWKFKASNPAGCDSNSCAGISCHQNFCQECPGGDCSQCGNLAP